MTPGRTWAAMMLALDVDTCASIVRGLRARVGNLDAFVLRRALRGAELPDPEVYIQITAEMLEAVDEAGPLRKTKFPLPPLPTTRGGRR